MNIWKERCWTPMLLKEVFKPFNSKEFIYELKFDGYRAIIFTDGKKLQVQSRNQEDITYLFPELQDIKKLVNGKVIFDGEIVILKNNIPSFKELQKRSHLKDSKKIWYCSKENPVVFICFDILYENKDITSLTLLERKNILNKYSNNDVFIKNRYIENNGIKYFNTIKRLNLEGIVAKKINSTYEINKRTDAWLKIKNIQKEIFYVAGYSMNKNNTLSLYLGELINNKLYYCGKVLLGNKNSFYDKIINLKTIDKSPFIDFDKNIHYINKIKCYIEYLEKTSNNHLRHPKFISEV